MSHAKWIIVFVACALMAAAPAHAQESFKRAEELLKKIQDTGAELKGASEQLGKTMSSLTVLSAAKGPGLRNAFADFDKSLNGLESKSNDVRKRATEMRAKGKDYFAVWQQETAAIQNADLRKASEARRVSLMASHEALTKSMADGRGAFVALMADLQDLRNFMGADLSDTTVAAARDLIATAQTSAKALDKTVAGIQIQLNGMVSRK